MTWNDSRQIPAIDVHGHYGPYTDGKSELGDWCMTADATEVAARALAVYISWTVASPFRLISQALLAVHPANVDTQVTC